MALDIITSISLDMQSPYSTTDMVYVNQYDSGLRVKAALLNAGQKWKVPSGAKAVVAFKKSDNIGGFYDVTDDDPSVQAVNVDSDRSVIYISLDAQTTTTSTTANKYVDMQVVFYQNGKRLSTFAFYMDVRPSVVTSKDVTSSWMFKILSKEIADTLTVATTPQAMTDWLEANISKDPAYNIDYSLTVKGWASDAQATGKMVTVSDRNPNTVANKVWVKKTPYEVQVPTVEELDEVKSAFEKEETNKDLWIVAGLSANGAYSKANIRLATRRFDYKEFIKCRTLPGYAVNVGAWDKNNVYLGKYDGNSFTTSSGAVNLTEFDFSAYPEYSFVMTLLNSTNPSTVMTLDDSENCIFEKNYLGLMRNVADSLSNYSIDLGSADNIAAGQAIHIPCDLREGDTVFVKMIGTPSSNCICRGYNNGVLVATIINGTLSSNNIGYSGAYTFTGECNEIRLYSNNEYSYSVAKVVYGHVDIPVVEQLAKTSQLALGNSGTTDIVADSNSAQILGELAIDINKQFLQMPKMKMVLLDSNYKYFSVANIKLIIDSMEQGGLNYLMLGFGGSGRGLCFELNDMHITSYGITYDLSNCLLTSSGKYLSESDMETIISYARSKNIDIIPSFNMPGHFGPFLNYQPQFRYGTNDNSIDIDNPQARDYAYKCAELYLSWFAKHDCKYWLFGADEFGNIITGYYNLHSAGNYNYALFINQIAYIVAKYRMIPLAWNDGYCIDGNLFPFLNRKVPVLYWRRATTHWATPTQISANGNKLINSSESIYWVANGSHPTEQKIRAFNVHEFRDGTIVADPIGACFCIWIGSRESPALDDDGDAITAAVRPLIVAFGETITPQFA